ncbi:MATE family efflux transporter [Tindallia californiensis]|uniref:Putative efflux protein, MATE family n=1 Tax=Tindallia californiensis TaxID=159292 RepID=A0A1H3QU07_9FIRM|nr:MATE family efflux transporter [Tindallia californiensis]SDZ16508.1 putative efflux protein, MATE family [Tindallia californiensis]
MKKKSFTGYLFTLTLPIIIQNLITTSLNLVDTFMIGRVGESELAAVGIANQYYFLFTLFMYGIAGGAAVFIAQLWGSQEKKRIKKVLARSLVYGTAVTGVFMLFGYKWTEAIIGIFNGSEVVLYHGSRYLEITLIGYLFTSISFVLAAGLRSINHTKIPMYASLIGLVINMILNNILIFGRWGMAPMGVEGAAVATIVARGIECLILLIFVYYQVTDLAVKPRDFIRLHPDTKKVLHSVTWPILCNEACWGLGMVTYVSLYARLGIPQAAAMQICSTMINLFMVIAFGLAYSALVMVGNEVGGGNLEGAMWASQKIRSMGLKVGFCLALLLFFIAPYISSLFNVTAEVKWLVTSVLRVHSVMFPLRMINMIMIVGVLRGGGDALFSTVTQGLVMWLIGIPLTYVAANLLEWPLPMVVAVMFAESMIQGLIVQRRYESNRWMKTLVA